VFDHEELEEIEHDIENLQEVGWTDTKLLLRIIRKQDERWEKLMATLQEIVDAVAQDDAAVQAAATRVLADLAALSAQVQTLSDQIAAGAGVTAADLDAVKAGIDAVTAEADAIDAPPAP
jgi:uncharacterized protein YceH (UPF0502 family)